MGKERGARRGRSNGRQLGMADKIRDGQTPPEPSFSGYRAHGERVPVLDEVTGTTLWSSVDPKLQRK